MPESVIALDPGERTGWAAATMDRDLLVFHDYGAEKRRDLALALAYVQMIGPPYPSGLADQREEKGIVGPFDVMVWEAWIPREVNGSMDWIKGDKLLSARHVGHFELIAWLSGAKTKEYGASNKKHFQSSMPPQLVAKQRAASEQHPKDAIMHLWGYFFENWFSATKPPEDCVVVETS